MDNEYLTADEVKKLLRCHYNTVINMRKRGDLTYIKPGKQYLYPSSQFIPKREKQED